MNRSLLFLALLFGGGVAHAQGDWMGKLTTKPTHVIHKQATNFPAEHYYVDTPAERAAVEGQIGAKLQNHTSVLDRQADRRQIKPFSVSRATAAGQATFNKWTGQLWKAETRTFNTNTFVRSWFDHLNSFIPGYGTTSEPFVTLINPDPDYYDGAFAVDVELWVDDPVNPKIVYGRIIRWYYTTGLARCINPDDKLYLARNIWPFAVPAQQATVDYIDRVVEHETTLRIKETCPTCCPVAEAPEQRIPLNWNGRSTSNPMVRYSKRTTMSLSYWRPIKVTQNQYQWQWQNNTPPPVPPVTPPPPTTGEKPGLPHPRQPGRRPGSDDLPRRPNDPQETDPSPRIPGGNDPQAN